MGARARPETGAGRWRYPLRPMFRKLLVANRGEVAVRIARAARELGCSPVGVVSTADRGSSWTEAFDETVCVGPPPPAESYLQGERMVQAALQTHSSAVHPGWGFLAEDRRFARLCRQHGVSFVGPPTSVMALLGVKSPAKAAMRAGGLEVIPGSEGPIAQVEAALACAQEAGYPVLLKADHGGGGRGMRLARNEAELREVFSSAQAEARSAFGSDSVYLERYVSAGRHIEVQLLLDGFGAGVHLGERECSVQRKHQKLIEESPSPALTAEERASLGERAVQAALSVGYENAGTMEFLRTPAGELFFMEVNARLQVEHPVTEMVSGVDVARKQIEIAAGCQLGLTQADVRLEGHSIECRINAEDPHQDFRPAPGRIEAFEIPTDRGPGRVRIDTHVRTGDTIPPNYDSLIAKVIVHADSRDAAIETMHRTLEGARIEGVPTTVPLHLAVLASDAFRSGEYDTGSIPGWKS